MHSRVSVCPSRVNTETIVCYACAQPVTNASPVAHFHLSCAHRDGGCGLSEIKYLRFCGFKFGHARCRFQAGEVVYDVMLNQTVSLRPCSTTASNSSLRTLQTTTTSTCSSACAASKHQHAAGTTSSSCCKTTTTPRSFTCSSDGGAWATRGARRDRTSSSTKVRRKVCSLELSTTFLLMQMWQFCSDRSVLRQLRVQN